MYMQFMELVLSDAVLTAALGVLCITAIILAAIVTEELRIRKQIGAWLARKDQPIIDVWGEHHAAYQVDGLTYLQHLNHHIG